MTEKWVAYNEHDELVRAVRQIEELEKRIKALEGALQNIVALRDGYKGSLPPSDQAEGRMQGYRVAGDIAEQALKGEGEASESPESARHTEPTEP